MKTIVTLKQKTPEELIALVDTLSRKVEQRDNLIVALQEQLKLEKLRHYGRKSEKDSKQIELGLFDEAEISEDVSEVEAQDEVVTVPAHKRKKPGRKPLPKDLPRIQKIHDLLSKEKICSCGCELINIGSEKSEQLDIIPAKVQVIEHIKLKYACRACEGTIKTAKIPKQPIPGSMASSGLLAYVLTAKYKDHLPLYRQEQIFQRMGIDIPRNTLSQWVIKCGNLLEPLYKILEDNIRSYDVAYADETRVQVLKEPNKKPESQSYMWCFIGGATDKRSFVYRYDPGRAHSVIEQALDEFKGYLHCDGYGAYDTYAAKHEVKLSACWMHARRKFVEVTKLSKSKGVADKMVLLIAKLYAVESDAKSKKYMPDQTLALRQEQSTKILRKIKGLLDEYAKQIIHKSPLGQAIRYSLNQWKKLTRFIEDGRLELDNGLTERAIKPFVIGRKNWMCVSRRSNHDENLKLAA